MKIYGNSSEVMRSDQARELQKNAGHRQKQEVGQSAAQAPRGDKVQISDAGRAMAAQTGSARGELSAERVAEVRERIISGAYNSLEIVDQVARKMLASGDI